MTLHAARHTLHALRYAVCGVRYAPSESEVVDD